MYSLCPKHNIENKHLNEWKANTQYPKIGILNILFLLFINILNLYLQNLSSYFF